MKELLPGLYHWPTFHDGIGEVVHSHYSESARALIDPRMPDAGLEAFERLAKPERILLTNRHHYRHSARFAAAFGCPVLCHEAGLHEFADGRAVSGFSWGDEVAPGITALEVGALCDEETALLIDAGPGALVLADSVIRSGGELAFVPDSLIGDDPPAVRAALAAALLRICDEHDFDALLLAHGDPVVTGGRAELRAFATHAAAG